MKLLPIRMTATPMAWVVCLWMLTGGTAFAGTYEQISFDTYHSQWNVDHGIMPTGSNNMAISGDGQIVCFDDMTVGETGLQCRDRATQTTEVISLNIDGTVLRYSISPAISRDGRFVAYWGWSTNTWDLYLHDRLTGTTKLVAPGEGGNLHLIQAPQSLPQPVSMSADGRYLVYGPPAYTAPDYPGQVDNGKIFDMLTGEKEDIRPYLPEEIRASYGNNAPILSGDGRYVAFYGYDPSTYLSGAFLFDRQAKSLKNMSAIGDLNNQYSCGYLPSSISDDGQRVMLRNLCYPGWPLLFDNSDESFTNVCTTATGEIGDSGCENVVMSANGRVALFTSYSQNLYPDSAATQTGGPLVKFIDEGFLDWGAVDSEGNLVPIAWTHLSPNGDFIGFLTYDSLVKSDVPPPDRYWFDRDHYIYARSSIALKSASYSTNRNELKVSVSSRLGEMAGLTVEGFGPMTYKSGTWSLTVNPGDGNPKTVTVSGVEGRASFPVDAN